MSDYEYVSFEDFKGGEFGELGPWRAPKNSFTGSNVLVYKDGLIGPRPGLADITPASVANGKVYGLFSPQLTAKPLMVVIGDKIYASSGEVGTLTLQDTLGATPADYVQADWYDPNGNIYLTSVQDKTYAVNWTAGTATAMNTDDAGTGTQGHRSVVLCRDRLYCIGRDSTVDTDAQRIDISNAAAFTTFGNWLDVGYFWDVYGAIPLQNSLLFGVRGQGWYALVGATPNGTLRQVDTFLAPGKQHEIVPADNGQVYFWSGWNGSNTQDPTLCVTDGAKFDGESLMHLRLSGTDRFGTYLTRSKALVYNSNSGNTGFVRVNGVWCKVDYNVSISGPNCTTGEDDWVVMVGGDSVATSAKFYAFSPDMDRPGAAGDTVLAQPGDASTTAVNAYFYLPAFQHAQARDMRVRRVIVDFKKWDLDVAGGTNSMTLNLRNYSRYNLAAGTTDSYSTITQTWSEAESATDASGQYDRHIFNIGEGGYTGAWQIGFTAMVGVAIQRVTIEYESAQGRPR